MANEARWLKNTEKTLEANGASIASGAFGTANDADLLPADVDGYPWVDVQLTCAFSVAPAAGDVVELYAQMLNLGGAGNHAPVPDASFKSVLMGAFVVDASTATQYLQISEMLPHDDIRLHLRNVTGQSLDAGWSLDVTPKTLQPTP